MALILFGSTTYSRAQSISQNYPSITFPNGWKYKEAITLKFLLQKTSLSSTTLRKYLEALIELGLIEKNTVKKETLYKLKNT